MRVGGEITTRVAIESDVEAICAFGEAHIRDHYEPLIGTAAAEKQVRDWWNTCVIEDAVADGAILIAEHQGSMIGVAQVSARAQPPTIYKLYVHPVHRGRGVGPILLDAVIASLPYGTSRLAIEHFAANERAGSFYEREGFAIDRTITDPSGDASVDIVWRSRELPSSPEQ